VNETKRNENENETKRNMMVWIYDGRVRPPPTTIQHLITERNDRWLSGISIEWMGWRLCLCQKMRLGSGYPGWVRDLSYMYLPEVRSEAKSII